MSYLGHPRTDPNLIRPGGYEDIFDRPFWAVSLAIVILGIAIWLVTFEHNHHPRIYRYNKDVTILQIGDSELDFNHPPGAFSIWWQSGGRNKRIWR